MNHFIKSALTVAALFTAAQVHGTIRKVLFIGNSYIYTNNMPLILKTLATAQGDTLVYDESDPGGYTLFQHSTYAPTIAKIYAQKWDVVVLQEQSQRPAFPPSQVATDTYPYAHILDSLIHDNDTCTQTMFMMTWGYANGDVANCPSYPVICTYAGMQFRLRESYLEMTKDNKAIVAPVGAAWKVVRDSFPLINLYQPDNSHPSTNGSYLEACVLYNSIFHKLTFGSSYEGGLISADARTLQHFADKVTQDSLLQWQQYGHYPSAGYGYTRTGSTFSFSSRRTIPAGYSWLFGDGGTDTSANPVHSYVSPGKYVVSHTALTDCFIETITDTVNTTGTTGSPEWTNTEQNHIKFLCKGGGNVTFVHPADNIGRVLELFDVNGKRVRCYNLITGAATTDNLTPCFYIVHTFSPDKKVSEFDKLLVY